MRPTAATLVLVAAFFSAGCSSASRTIEPVIYAQDDQAAAAMRSAPLILVVKIASVESIAKRMVKKPPEVGGPMVPRIPLHLARIRADVLLAVRGAASSTVEFYSWVWASGSHGGPRLFRPDPGKIRVVFLRNEGRYLHTVGDYPSYDLVLPSDWVPALLSGWKSGYESRADPLERLVALRFRAEFEGLSVGQLREDFDSDGPRVNHYWATDLEDLVRVVGPFFVVSQLDSICHHSANPSARLAACFVSGEYFPGRCGAFRLAQEANGEGIGGDFLMKKFRSCEAAGRNLAADLLSGDLSRSRFGFGGWSLSPPHRRELLRVYASAMDHQVHLAACDVAAITSEARDIPECAALQDRR